MSKNTKNGGNPNFYKGMQPLPGAGRPKGSKKVNQSYESVRDTLNSNEKNPTQEILNLIAFLDYPDQLKAWCFLISYSQPRPDMSAIAYSDTASIAQKVETLTDEELSKIVAESLKNDKS